MSESTKAVFLSYACEDADAARRIAEALRAFGVEVWFDQNELRGGDQWDQKIRKQIRECTLFVPMISAHTQARGEGYFRREWKLAVERMQDMGDHITFLVPIALDETNDREAHVPESFLKVQWTRIPNGEVPAEFVARMKILLGASAGRTDPGAGSRLVRAREEGRGQAAPLPRKRSPLVLVAASFAAVAVIGAAWFFAQKSAAPATLLQLAAATTPPIVAAPATAPAIVAPTASEKSVAVLPFENLSADPSNAAFADGMHAETIGAVSQLGDVKVISRTSALALKGSTLSLAEIGKKLGVANVITGSVRREADRVRVQLELRRATDEAVLWSKVFDQQVKDVFAIQNEIATEVARVLQARDRRGTNAGAQFMTKDPRAYDLFVKLRQEYDATTFAALSDDFIRRLEELVQLDPKFMPAVSILATTHVRAFIRELSRDPAAAARHAKEAKPWADAASALVPGGAGDGALAYYHNIITRDFAQALVFGQNVVRALPNDAAGHNFMALALYSMGRLAEAHAAWDRALELDPFNSLFQSNRLGFLSTTRRREAFAIAVAYWKATHENSPPPNDALYRFGLYGELPPEATGDAAKAAPSWLWRARRFKEVIVRSDEQLAGSDLTELQRHNLLFGETLALRHTGQTGEAAKVAQLTLAAAEKLSGANEIDPTENFTRLALAKALAQRTEEAVTTMRRSIELARVAGQTRLAAQREVILAQILAETGRTRECVELLAKCLREPSNLSVQILRVSPDWDNVRNDPAFKALLADPKNDLAL